MSRRRWCDGWRWPRPAAGRVHDRGHSAHRQRPVWLAPWERSGQRCDVSRECPRAQALRKWAPTPIWTLGTASGMRRTGRPEPSYGVRVVARWDSIRMGRGAHTVDHGVRPDPGCARNSRDQHHRKCRPNGFAGWVVLGVVAGWVACSIPPDCESTQAVRLLVGVLGRSGCIAARRGFGRHLLQPRRVARRMRWRHRVVGDPQHPRRPVEPAPFPAS
jgi:hypothetical protein